jgi:hypothetical protein
MRFGQKIQLLTSLSKSGALHTADRECRERLIKLIRAALFVSFDIKKGEEAAQSIRIQDYRDAEQSSHKAQCRHHVAILCTRKEKQQQTHRHHQCSGSEIGFSLHQDRERSDEQKRIKISVFKLTDPRLVQREIVRKAEHKAQLRELGNLQQEGPNAQPATCTTAPHADLRDEHEHEQHQKEPCNPPGIPPHVVEVDPAHHKTERGGHGHPDQLFA